MSGTRPDWIEGFQRTGNTVMFWTHACRMMIGASGPYDTSLGSGTRFIEMTTPWGVSTFLSGVVNDPKNAAALVPAVGNLRTKGLPRLVTTSTEYEWPEGLQGNRLFQAVARPDTVRTMRHDMEASSPFPSTDGTLFESMCHFVDQLAEEGDDGSIRRAMRDGFELILTLGNSLSAEMVWPFPVKGDDRTAAHILWGEESVTATTSDIPIRRQVVIQGAHMEMLASLRAMKPTRKAKPETAGQEPLSLDQDATPDASSTNENADPATGSAPTRNQNRSDAAPGLNIREYAGERDTTQSPRHRRSGPPHPIVRTTRNVGRELHPAFAPGP